MPHATNSRETLTKTVFVISADGVLLQPPFQDIRPRVTEEADDDRLLTVDASNTWGGLGLNYLLDASAWWAIADLSGVIDPFAELTPGATLRIPSTQRYLFKILGNKKL